MSRSPPPAAVPETLEETAAGWFARRRSGQMTVAELRDFEAWLDRDLEHRAAFEHVEDLWRASAMMRADPEVMALRDAAKRAHPLIRPRRLVAAAAAVAAVVGGWAAIDAGLVPGLGGGEQAFATGVGQTATVTLRDGSKVTLDTDTRLRTRESGRRRQVWLDHGQAFFRVAHDPSRPFVVAAGGKTVTAVGTAFDVRLDGRRLEVTLVQGKVRVEAPGESGLVRNAGSVRSTDMTPGSQLVAAPDRGWKVARVDTDKAVGWMAGQLTFVRRPIGEVAAELNRYSEKKIVIRDPAAAAQPITGGSATGDVRGFVEAVQNYDLAQVAGDSDTEVELAAR